MSTISPASLDRSAESARVDAIFAARAPYWPSSWPLIAPGMYMGFFGRVLFILHGASLDSAGLETYLHEVDAGMTLMGQQLDSPSVCSYVEFQGGPWWDGLSVRERGQVLSRYAAVTKPHQATLNRVSRVSVTYAHSMLARAALRTLNTLVRPPYPVLTVASSRQAFTAIARHESGDDITLAPLAHAQLVAKYLPSLGTSVSTTVSTSVRTQPPRS